MTKPDPRRLRVLIVEESPILGRELAAFLAEVTEVSLVGIAEDAATALSLFFEHRPDVVLVSVCLPDRDGFDVLQSVKQGEPDCAVILMTRHPNPSVEVSGRLLGATAVFAKSSGYGVLRELLVSLLWPKAEP
jgi:two-component system nitrate/nitrite response regulator NarL